MVISTLVVRKCKENCKKQERNYLSFLKRNIKTSLFLDDNGGEDL